MRTNDASAVAGRTEAGSKRPVGPVSDRTPLACAVSSGSGLVRPVGDRSYAARKSDAAQRREEFAGNPPNSPVGPVSDRTPWALAIPSGVGLRRPVEDRSYGLLEIGRRLRPRLQWTLAGLLAAMLLAGCGSHADSAVHADGDGHDHAAEAAPAAVFKAGRGLQLGATAAQFIGLATAEVAARDLPGAAGAPAIPEAALLRTVRGDFVFVANGGWYLRTPVQIGAVAGGWVEIRDGLYEGDTVVAQGARALWLAEIQAVNGGVSCTHGH